MKRITVFGLVTFAAAAALLGAESSPKEAVTERRCQAGAAR